MSRTHVCHHEEVLIGKRNFIGSITFRMPRNGARAAGTSILCLESEPEPTKFFTPVKLAMHSATDSYLFNTNYVSALNTKMTFIQIFKVILRVKFKVKERSSGYRPKIMSARVPNWSQTIASLPERSSHNHDFWPVL